MKLFLCLIMLLPFAAGAQIANKPVAKTPEKQATDAKKPINFITHPCAIVIIPSNKAIAKLQKTNSDDDYSAIVDDNTYYQGQSTGYLDSVKLKQVQKESAGSVFFKTVTGQVFQVKLNMYTWAIILFNGKSKPIDADMTNIKADYDKYMK